LTISYFHLFYVLALILPLNYSEQQMLIKVAIEDERQGAGEIPATDITEP
jgi:hypothetical protein